MSTSSIKINARRVVVDSSTVLERACVIVHDGVIVETGPIEALCSVRADKVVDLRKHTLLAGLVNAHCHLELSCMEGMIRPGAGFTDWIKKLITIRAGTSRAEVSASAGMGARRMMQTGTTCVGDISMSALTIPVLIKSGMRGVVFHEVLGFDPAVADERFAELKNRLESSPSSALVSHGVSPHAVYSVSPALMKRTARYAARRNIPLSIHLCETPDEALFSTKGKGPFRELLESMGLYRPGWRIGVRPVEAVRRAGALKGALLAHMNHPAHGDLALLAREGARVVYCPNSNRWFGRAEPYPLPKLLDRGIAVALGTDSLASNTTGLDMRAEMRTVLKNFPDMSAGLAFRMATQDGARALGLPKDSGTLRVGAPFDAVALKTGPGRCADIFSAIIRSRRPMTRVWVDGVERYRYQEE